LKREPGYTHEYSFAISLKEYRFLFPFFIFYTAITALACHFPFFWDKDILFSKIAYWLLENGFSILLPDHLDAGYPPALGYLLALAWKITGTSLPAMHFLMLPFSIGIVIQLYRIIRYYMPGNYIIPVMILVLIDPVLLSQSILFSTDLVMIFFLLLAVNAILYHKRIMLSLAITGLFFCHMRGAMAVAMVGLFDLYKKQFWVKPMRKLSLSFPYLPGLVLFVAFTIYHYLNKGWIGYHKDSPWIGCFEIVDVKGFFLNIGIVGWRLMDFGKLFVWITLFYLLVKLRKQGYKWNETLTDLLVLLILAMLVFVPVALMYKVLSSHRYFLPITIIIFIITGYLLSSGIKVKFIQRLLFIIMVSGLISGNFWVYPDNISKGWDSSLAYIPYFSLQKKMLRYIDENKISYNDIGTEVPSNYPRKYYELSHDERYMPLKDFQHNPYILYSNIHNTFTDNEIQTLKSRWKVEKEFRCLQVRVTLYKNPVYK
jgi:hypothetical protein